MAGESVFELIQRRPCSIDDVAGGLGIHRNEASKYIEELLAQKKIESEIISGKKYFRPLHGK
jgi:predicted ArsR family transcriptional regulator